MHPALSWQWICRRFTTLDSAILKRRHLQTPNDATVEDRPTMLLPFSFQLGQPHQFINVQKLDALEDLTGVRGLRAGRFFPVLTSDGPEKDGEGALTKRTAGLKVTRWPRRASLPPDRIGVAESEGEAVARFRSAETGFRFEVRRGRLFSVVVFGGTGRLLPTSW